MPEYKCISCGAVRDSDKNCSCPVCGYKMFEMPYEKEEILKKEIKDFIGHLRLDSISNHALKIYRKVPKKKGSDSEEDFDIVYKNTDDQRFPGFHKIQNYVCGSNKTEMFYEKLMESLDEIQNHIHSEYKQEYIVSLDNIKDKIGELDITLNEALKTVEIEQSIPEVILPEIKLNYCETPDESLLNAADEIIESLKTLAAKIKKFIKQNNIYGTAYKEKPKTKLKLSEDKNYADDLRKCFELLQKTIAKKYIVDIFSDGTEELGEMLKSLWYAIEVIMTVPILSKEYQYAFSNGFTVSESELKGAILEIISHRYEEIDTLLFAYDFLADKTEDELFELYDKMIDLDSFGILGVNKSNLLKIGESEKKLNELIGLKGIKDSVKKIKAYALANKDADDLNVHMCFLGNPGCGKTEVARFIAGILYENKILPTKKIIEVDRSGLVSQYFGATAEKTSQVIARAMGGVLFVDEAYALANTAGHGDTDYGKEAIDTLVKAMEDYRGKFCVIFAGYRNEMQKMLQTNPGLKSRIQFTLDFPNYSREELKEITELMLAKRKYSISDTARNRMLDITDVKRKEVNFANAREVRNILDQVIMCQNVRCAGTGDTELGIVDVNQYIKDAKINLPTGGSGTDKKILTGEEELDQLIGLSTIKKMVKKIKAYAKRNSDNPDFNMHMCFYGNPGTGKTEVARIISRILYDAGVLAEAKLVETDAFGLIGQAVGTTGPKTKAKIADALGGVLFIDEAYALSNNKIPGVGSYGSEAISVLLKEMEDKRGQFCVVLAGYKNEMEQMLSSNPGFKSRIQFTLEFPDYSRDELGEIAKLMVHKEKYEITDEALFRILDISDYERKQPNYANARSIRNTLDQVILNQNLRTEDDTENQSIIILEDVEDYIEEKRLSIPKDGNSESEKVFIDVNQLKDDYYEFDEEVDTTYITQAVISISSSSSQGTGFIISKNGICLTCAHCIQGNGSGQKARVSMLLANGKLLHMYSDFKLIDKDENNDIAVIKLDDEMEYTYLPLLPSNYKYIPLKEFIMAGYPFGGETYQAISFTEGKIASVNQIGERRAVFADMFGKPGNSGSPVIDSAKKKVIGIFWGGITQPGTNEMIPCFTPLDQIWNLLSTSEKK